MSYQHYGVEVETPSGVILVSGIPEWEERVRKANEENPIKWRVLELSGLETKVDLIHLGVFTEESYKEAVYQTSLRMILMGARRDDDGYWRLESERSVWTYHSWNWEQPMGGYSKSALERLLRVNSESPSLETP